MRRILLSLGCVVGLTGVAAAERPKLLTITVPDDGVTTDATAAYNTIFLNRCASGCNVRPGNNDSRATPDTSPIVGAPGVLTKFTYGDDAWNKVVACVRDTFSPFNVNITDVDPGSANHFEIMIGGLPTDIGFDTNVGGVSTNGCGHSYLDNAVVFDFADVWSASTTTCNSACIEDVCSTAAQEIGHSFGLDHSTNNKDPMTYYQFGGRKYFQNEADTCGSDCGSNGKGPMGNTCTNNAHTCCVNEGTTQNSYQSILSLFGPGTPAIPNVTINSPKQGASVQAGFPVSVTAMADAPISMVALTVDGMAVNPVLMTGPFAFNAPATLAPGPHTVLVTATDAHGTPGTATVTVTIGPPCTSADMCPNTTDACIDGRCVPGPGVAGGLGTSCTDNSMCGDSTCASDGENQYCTTACANPGDCPSGFGCLPAADGATAGYCWPGYNDGTGGGGGCNSGAGGPISGGLAFAALLFTRRRKR